MAQKDFANPGTQGRERACVHHWLIETPNGAMSRGCCKRCGASRAFGNAFEYPRPREENRRGWPFPARRREDEARLFD